MTPELTPELIPILRSIVANSPSVIFVKDLEDRYLIVNSAWERATGIAAEDAVGRTNDLKIWTEAEREMVDDNARRMLESGEPALVDEHFELRDGPQDFSSLRFPLRDTEGRIFAFCGIMTDVTPRREAERALAERDQLFEAILRSSPDIVILLDEFGHVVEVSHSSWAIVGYKLPGLIASDATGVVHDDDLKRMTSAFEDLYRGRIDQAEERLRVRHADGHWVVLESRASPLVDERGRVVGAVVVCRDVGAHLEAEERLREALATAEQASRAKSEFVSHMSHELRTPLNAVMGFTQLLGMEDLTPSAEQYVEHIQRAGRHLYELIEDVLDIARIEAGRVELSIEPTSLAEVVMEAVGMVEPLAQAAGVALDSRFLSGAEHLFVDADRQRLLQVLLNLLTNGVKYNLRGGRVQVSWAPRRGQDGQARVRLAIEDTGLGIAAQDQDRVFEPFERIGAEKSGIEGTGVGLAVAKQLVQQMSGSIGVESARGAGSVFWVELPVAAATPGSPRTAAFRPTIEPVDVESRVESGEQEAIVPEPVPRGDGVPGPAPRGDGLRRPRILYIEDDLTNLDLVDRAIERCCGAELIAAVHGRVGLELARAHLPDLVLLDLGLPDMPGAEVLRRLRADPSTASIPVVVVSADVFAVRALEARGHIGVTYMSKPIDLEKLVGIVNGCLSSEPSVSP
jgi:PAS domain S-box-containing protein